MPSLTPQQEGIAERVRLARRLAGMTQKDAADALGVTERTYARWERKENLGFLDRVADLANVFGTTVEELRGESESADPDEPVKAMLQRILDELSAIRALLDDPAMLRQRVDDLIAEERGK